MTCKASLVSNGCPFLIPRRSPRLHVSGVRIRNKQRVKSAINLNIKATPLLCIWLHSEEITKPSGSLCSGIFAQYPVNCLSSKMTLPTIPPPPKSDLGPTTRHVVYKAGDCSTGRLVDVLVFMSSLILLKIKGIRKIIKERKKLHRLPSERKNTHIGKNKENIARLPEAHEHHQFPISHCILRYHRCHFKGTFVILSPLYGAKGWLSMDPISTRIGP
ncbi:hypothetical protein CEXT_715551 [Caerostris extrusa]|uniref:Uncharacterized protein n=1 Tax=Caerostris extrusa TaxID=172846 RepID=A0AAV4PFY9_CAEEX|nr:hypothetical protein CEXT_715551 [Caerostris extrusa]